MKKKVCKMKINYMSDMHLEFGPFTTMPSGETLILAGDISVQTEHWEVIKEYGQGFKDVIYIFGNHEYYAHGHGENNCHYAKLIREAQKFFKGSNVHFLENECITLGGVKFVCCTLWSDFLGGSPDSMATCQQKMNDYRRIKYHDGVNYFCITPAIIYRKHLESRKFLEDNVTPGCVVVTHHAPSAMSLMMKHHTNGCDGAYYTDLHSLIRIKRPNVWVHGHTHKKNEYVIGQTRILGNPRGYVNYETNPYFNPNASFEV